MDLGLQNKRAVVFASSKGIGRGIARRLAQEGASVTICARNEEALRRTEEEMRAAGGDVLALPADAGRYDDIKRVIAATVERWGTLHILVTNAGGPPLGHFEEMTEAQWQLVFDVNLLSAIRMCREALPYMKAQRWGRIVHVNTTAVKEPILEIALSSVVRPGVVGLSKTLALEYAQYNITSNSISVAAVWTSRNEDYGRRLAQEQGVDFEELKARYAQNFPARRFGTTEEAGALAAFLASDLAGYVNGQNISLDGAYTKGIL
jgi:3-oxoacyl-[acyl-carrier protein] reductase